MGLVAHCDTRRVEEAVVKQVVTPDWTQTWHPVGHHQLITALEGAVATQGLEVVKREYSLNALGTRMFGVWDLNLDISGRAWSVGFRNSLDKSLSIGICGGQRVFVCDNLAFSGEFIEFRKHTAGLDFEELTVIAGSAMDKAQTLGMELISWTLQLRDTWLESEDLAWLTVAAMTRGAITPSKFHEFGRCLQVELDLESGLTLYVFHAAVTRLMRGESLFRVSEKNTALNSVIRDYLLKEVDSDNTQV